MNEGVPPAPNERGWGRLLLALAAFLFVPLMPPFGALLPVQETLLLLLPALAACCLVGWWAGGRLALAVVWVALAVYIVNQPASPGTFYNLVRGWSLLLGGVFGLVCLFGGGRPLLPRALTSLSLALVIAVGLSLWGPMSPSRAKQALETELASRDATTIAAFRGFVKEHPEVTQKLPEFTTLPDEFEAQFKVVSQTGVRLYPSLLLLESLLALALAWATFHRLSRTRLGVPLGHLKEFRFNDQLVWGLIVGLTIVFVPALDFLGGAGRNLLVFFGALYAIRGFGVLSWFMAPGALAATMFVGFAMLFWPVLSMVAVFGFILLALAAFGLGLGDTWADWRRRARPTT